MPEIRQDRVSTEWLAWSQGKLSNTETTYNTEKDEDGGTNTFIPLARALLGTAYNIGNRNGTSSGTGREEITDDNYASLKTQNELGAIREVTNSDVIATTMENIARKYANVPLREVRDEGTLVTGFQPPPEPKSLKELCPPPPAPTYINPSERKCP